jgi:hypothetical protein
MTKQSLLTPTLLDDLSAVAEKTCVSLYLPTHRHHPENQQDPIRFRRLVKELRSNLRNLVSEDEIDLLLAPFNALAGDEEFWNQTLDGLAVFAAPGGFFRLVSTYRTLSEMSIISDTFHTKPLRRFLQSSDRYQILALSLHDAKLFEGNRDSLEVVELAEDFPDTIKKALGEELTGPHQTVASYGGTGGESMAMRHGHGGKSDEIDDDTERYFRAVDRSVLKTYSGPSGLPLILAALPEHHHLFHTVSHNSLLTDDGIKVHSDAIPIDELRARAWEIFEPLYHARLDSLADDFSVAKSQQLGLDDLAEIGAAAVAGRIATLLIEADREIPGRIHTGSGNIHLTDADGQQGDDLLDDLGEWVIKNGGKVMVVPSERMPVATGAAAVCRY